MAKEIELHPIQAAALRVLMFKPTASFTELNAGKVSTDQFNFHLKQLVTQGLIRKYKTKYELSPKGKEFTNRFDTDTKDVKYERQAKLGVLVAPRKKVGRKEYWMLQQRLKQPFYGFWGRITGKIRWGQTALETAHRELLEEAGLMSDKMIFKRIEHKMDYAKSGELLEEKFFFVFLADNAKGELITELEGGRNQWMTWEEKEKQKNQFSDMKSVDQILLSDKMIFKEKKYTVTGY